MRILGAALLGVMSFLPTDLLAQPAPSKTGSAAAEIKKCHPRRVSTSDAEPRMADANPDAQLRAGDCEILWNGVQYSSSLDWSGGIELADGGGQKWSYTCSTDKISDARECTMISNGVFVQIRS